MAIKYLVPDGKHLPYTDESGKPDHRLMGAAWAALHGGYRGNEYSGPNKSEAIDKLRRIYHSEGMTPPGESESKGGDGFFNDDAIECRIAVSADISPTSTNEILFLPVGLHAITPVSGGIGRPIKVHISEESAVVVENQRRALMANGKRPYFDFNHEDGPASFWPDSFEWRNGEGVIAKGDWSKRGREAVEGRDYRAFSPVFHVDNKRADAAQVICKQTADPNMGGLVNNPAFKNLPLWAKNAEQLGNAGANTGDNAAIERNKMENEELAALRAKQSELQKEVDDLKAKGDTNAEPRELELQNITLQIEAEALRARNAAQDEIIKARNLKDATATVKSAVQRGAILAKDLKSQNAWITRIAADPDSKLLLDSVVGNIAITSRIAGPGRLQVMNDDPSAIYAALARVVSNQRRVVKTQDKSALSREFASIYAREISPFTAGDNRHRTLAFAIAEFEDAIQAADVTDTNLGTLSGTLVTQRTLELLKFTFPALTMFTTDFSDEPAKFNQTVMTRTITVPAVVSYNTSTGWAAQTAASTDVPVTIDSHRGVPIKFNENLLASTVRRLFDEFAPAQAYALAKDMMDDLYSNITDANFTHNSVITTASFNRASVVDVGVQQDLLGVPSGMGQRTMLLYPTVFGNLEKDTVLMQLAQFQRPDLITNPAGPNNVSLVIKVEDYQVVKAPNLPTNNGNVTGFAGAKSALCIAARVPNDYTSFAPGVSNGNVQVVTDPDLGLSVMLVQYVDHDLGTGNQRIALMYGTNAGQGNAGYLIKAASGSGSSRTS